MYQYVIYSNLDCRLPVKGDFNFRTTPRRPENITSAKLHSRYMYLHHSHNSIKVILLTHCTKYDKE